MCLNNDNLGGDARGDLRRTGQAPYPPLARRV